MRSELDKVNQSIAQFEKIIGSSNINEISGFFRAVTSQLAVNNI